MKMKTVKRFMATALATAMTLRVVACGNTAPTDTPASSDKAPEAPESSVVEESSEEDLGAYTVIKDANGNTVDLGGIEVIIRDWWSPAEAAEQGPSSQDVVLASCGANKIAVIKLIKEVTGLGLGEAKAIADNGGVLKEKASADEANELKAKFEEAGATIELK